MVRLVKRYGGGSRKLYDTEESRYVSLEEIAAWVRAGQQVRVVDSAGGEDVTAQTLAQVIYETHKAGTSVLPVEFLHEAIRRGGQAIQARVDRLRRNVEDLAKRGLAGAELPALKASMEALERSVAELEGATRRRRGANGRRRKGAGRGRM